jgi:calcineurin-like phosphoesterase family protein
MSLVYWFSDGAGLGANTGGTDGKTPIPTAMVRWIRKQGVPSLIINGGDVYPDGKAKEFTAFLKQMDNDLSLMCETAGNHDWRNDPDLPQTGRIPQGYDTFWRSHPESKQPVDSSKRGGARYDHFIDVDGWRLIFLDTGDYDNGHPWPAGDLDRVTWLENSFQPGRANIVVAHHSRLSRGHHGDNDKLDFLWKQLFDGAGAPRVAFTLAGHDHNVSVFGPRSRDNPKGSSVTFDKGVHVFVNGAGGHGNYSGTFGTKADIFFDDENWCVTRIDLIDAKSADVDVLSFGTAARTAPVPIAESLVKIRL